MKVALVFTGLLRCWDQAYPSIYREILNKYNPDVFFDIWDEIGFYSGKGYLQGPDDEYVKIAEGDKGFYENSDLVYGQLQNVHIAYEPKRITIDKFSDFEPEAERFASEFTNAYTRPKNTVSMFWRIRSGATTLQSYGLRAGSYDYIIRMRPDLIINSPLPSIKEDTIITMRHKNKYNQGTSDGFQMGPRSPMLRFMWDTYTNLRTFYWDRSPQGTREISCPHLYTQCMINRLLDYATFPHLKHEEHHVEF